MPPQVKAGGNFRGQLILISESFQNESQDWQVKRKPRKKSNKRFVKPTYKGFKVERAAMDFPSKGVSDKSKAVLLKKARVKPFATYNPLAKIVIDKKMVGFRGDSSSEEDSTSSAIGRLTEGIGGTPRFLSGECSNPQVGIQKLVEDPNISNPDSSDERDCIRPLKAVRMDPSKGVSPNRSKYLLKGGHLEVVLNIEEANTHLTEHTLVLSSLPSFCGSKLMDEGEELPLHQRVTHLGSKEGIASVSSAAAEEDEGLKQASVPAQTVTLRKRGRPRKFEQAARNRKVLP
ncbi:hypothetical protein QYF36_023827 [Acer negundo]|nr:hypothetical protein QYF36_023827 [Acer negundo]